MRRFPQGPRRDGRQHAEEQRDDHEGVAEILRGPRERQTAKCDIPGILPHEAGELRTEPDSRQVRVLIRIFF